jgi:hypothetical protein
VGTWGAGVFDSDTAAEVREAWREAVLDGLDPLAASERVLTDYESSFQDPEDAVVAWLALALAQHETGRLQDDVRDRALAIIAAGADLERWQEENPPFVVRRRRALDRLAAKLTGPQPRERRLRRTKPVVGVSFDAGEVVHLRGDGGTEALFAVVGGGSRPIVAPLLWEGGKVPAREELERLPGLLEEARAPWQAPERIGPISRVVFEVSTLAKDELFTEELGSVVARDVHRPDLEPTRRPTSYPTWGYLAEAVGPKGYLRRAMADTPRLLALIESGAAELREYDPFTGQYVPV